MFTVALARGNSHHWVTRADRHAHVFPVQRIPGRHRQVVHRQCGLWRLRKCLTSCISPNEVFVWRGRVDEGLNVIEWSRVTPATGQALPVGSHLASLNAFYLCDIYECICRQCFDTAFPSLGDHLVLRRRIVDLCSVMGYVFPFRRA
jgi:hypothetical protein